MAEEVAKPQEAAKPESAAKAEEGLKPGHVSPRGGFYIGLLVGLGIAVLACLYQAKQFHKVKRAMDGVRDATIKDAAAAKGEALAAKRKLAEMKGGAKTDK
ncbi:MAG: hypothetical protein NTW87_30695 [Planctomycetota bacterium]|nr:hypothetical protein [Planctomycetota bacterium]